MQALFFGSIGTIVETSQLQYDAFHVAFAQHGLEWHWEKELGPLTAMELVRELVTRSGRVWGYDWALGLLDTL